MGVTIIKMNDADAASYFLWLKYQERFRVLLDNRVFELRNGTAEINFDPQGEIGSIELHAKVYRRK